MKTFPLKVEAAIKYINSWKNIRKVNSKPIDDTASKIDVQRYFEISFYEFFFCFASMFSKSILQSIIVKCNNSYLSKSWYMSCVLSEIFCLKIMSNFYPPESQTLVRNVTKCNLMCETNFEVNH